ncbi:hypothetical protein K491DRAFT_699815 [Lophiostoma macrostomum CBS 122681]|uniref:Uncharacterized protein n=1 Tax=Lophiostoma macrostomum CBS 122681 TaxID=1314788 RepID=A0A6A6SHC1_9PLEO|nr:hypothetical protein K491DRAFT_699815 [Lophiostoma macrostomum CBS 122681]
MATFKTIGFTEFFTDERGREFKRRRGTQKWKPVSDTVVPEPVELDDARGKEIGTEAPLYLVRFKQYEGEPLHWSLIVSDVREKGRQKGVHGRNDKDSSVEDEQKEMENEDDEAMKTRIFEVRGDPEGMHHNFETRITPVELLDDVHSIFELATLSRSAMQVVEEVANEQKAPWAENRREARENCQGWCVRVVKKLVDRGVVKGQKVAMLEGMIERFDGWNQLG